MKTLALLLLLQADDPYAKLRDGWTNLQDVWKGITEFHSTTRPAAKGKPWEKVVRPDDLPDDLVRIIGRASAAMEGAGLWGDPLPPDLLAVRQVFKARLAGLVRPRTAGTFATPTSEEEVRQLNDEYQRLSRDYEQALQEYYQQRQPGGAKAEEKKPPVGEFETAVASLGKLLGARGADEDLIQDAIARVRKSMRDSGIFDDETPAWIRMRLTAVVRALALGEKMPEPAKATPEQEKRVKNLLDAIQSGDLEGREEAVRELLKIGEPGIPLVRRKLAETEDSEVKVRLRRVLGYREKK